MGRRRRCRHIGWAPEVRWFRPCGVPRGQLHGVAVSLDGVEAMRLVDGEGLTQEEAAQRMGVSKATVCRILAQARRQVARALSHGMAIRIGDVEDLAGANAAPLRRGSGKGCCSGGQRCWHVGDKMEGEEMVGAGECVGGMEPAWGRGVVPCSRRENVAPAMSRGLESKGEAGGGTDA